jgi:hypothetical protein
MSGLIEIPGRPGDFVFLVTFGRSQGEHNFDEGVSTEGVLRWQSQPHQELDDPRIERLIRHDTDRNFVHLFLRTAAPRGGVVAPTPTSAASDMTGTTASVLGRFTFAGRCWTGRYPMQFALASIFSSKTSSLTGRRTTGGGAQLPLRSRRTMIPSLKNNRLYRPLILLHLESLRGHFKLRDDGGRRRKRRANWETPGSCSS